MPILHIGKKAPKGFVECGPAIHMGKGIWILTIKPKPKEGMRFGVTCGCGKQYRARGAR